MNTQLFYYILALNREGYQVIFELYTPFSNAIKITLSKSSFCFERFFDIDEIASCNMDADSVAILKLSEMKAKFENEMKLREKMRGEDDE